MTGGWTVGDNRETASIGVPLERLRFRSTQESKSISSVGVSGFLARTISSRQRHHFRYQHGRLEELGRHESPQHPMRSEF